jgi:rubrerythrin
MTLSMERSPMQTPELSASALSPPPRMELVCSLCGYGIVSREPPERCPMCGSDAAWVEPPRRNLGGGGSGPWLAL